MNPDLLHILQHSLGLDQHGRPPKGYRGNSDDDFPGCYRNRFITGADSPDGLKCQELVRQGFMVDHGPQSAMGGMNGYSVNQAGFEAVKRHSPSAPRISRGKARWRAFRRLREVCPGLTFPAFLKSDLRERLELEEFAHP